MNQIQVQKTTQLPDVFFLLPDIWEPVVARLEQVFKLGDIYIFETPMGKHTFRIRCVEVLT